jgi:hypothetical protein
MRTVFGLAVAGGMAYAAWRRSRQPGTEAHRFVETVRTASAEREALLREAVAAMEEADQATPYSDARAARGEGLQPGRHAAAASRSGAAGAAGAEDPRSLSAAEARELLLDPTGRRGADGL